MANAAPVEKTKNGSWKDNYIAQRDEVRKHLESMKSEIAGGIKTGGDGFEEEFRGLDPKAAGKDKEALVKFYIAISKRFDAPALYS